MRDDIMDSIKDLVTEMEQCLEMPVEIIADEDEGQVTIMCGTEVVITDFAEYVQDSLVDMLGGMWFYKRMKGGK